MLDAQIIGLDIAKSSFQVHAVNADGEALFNKKLRRSEVVPFFRKQAPCLVVLEACATSHYWARTIADLGHTAKLIAPEAAKPFVKKGKKNDAVDAGAIAQAARRTDIHFVPVKTTAQQGILSLHSARGLLVKQKVMLSNALRNLASEFGIVVPLGMHRLGELRNEIAGDANVPAELQDSFSVLFERLNALDAAISTLTDKIVAHVKGDTVARRLATIPGVGPLAASLVVGTVTDMKEFGSARRFAAWLGLVPRQNSTGGKARLGRITRSGNRGLRTLLVIGATSMLRRSGGWMTTTGAWLRSLAARKPSRVATVALANKMARVIWAMMTREEIYRAERLSNPSQAAVA